MTNHWNDLKNTDCCLIIGSNAAENHPISFKWLTEAREKRGAKIIHVDPRFTRTSARSDIYAPIRPGTDIAFIGGMINYILENKLYHEEYVREYTNATFIVKDTYDFNDGLFSGYDPVQRKYDKNQWAYEMTEDGQYVKDMTMQHPRCVLQLLKKHFSRYDIKTVCKITGTPENKYLEVLKTYCTTGAPDKAGTIMYAMGTTQHTVGTQNVRSYAILQLLLGNMGKPGGGVNALRGESNVQGSTDWALLYHILPGYLASPQAKHKDLKTYLEMETPKTGYWKNKPKFMVSFLKSYWMQDDPEKSYHYLPKRENNKNYSHIAMFEAMYKNEIEGLFIWGSNPIVGGPNANKEQAALAKLKWMVAIDLWQTETSEFWTYKAADRPTDKDEYGTNLTPDKIQTEVFFLPACASFEKEGSVSNSGRWMQYRWKAADPVGESRADLEIVHDLMLRIKKLYQGSTKPQDEPITHLTWDYGPEGHPDIDKIAREINGFTVINGKPGKQIANFTKLADDGSTACSNWIYSGCYPDNEYLAKRRDNRDIAYPGTKPIGSYSNWAWCWPVNRRILYNRCSATPDGRPWDKERVSIFWDGSAWVGNDVPDFAKNKNPNEPGGKNAFIMRPEEVGCIFSACAEGPFPEHYEPWESPVKNLLNSQPFNPAIVEWEPKKRGTTDKYPIIGTTYRVSEHWQSGVMTRMQPWLAELVPDVFVEMSEELAKEKGIRNGDKVIIMTTRGDIKAVACVTKRFKPLNVAGKKIHHIGVLWHFGFNGYATGDPANRLTPHVGDANTTIPEYKAWLCNIRRA